MTEIAGCDLSPEELTTFARCEGVIERGLATFVDVGTALLEIRDGRFYRTDFGTFEDYCRDRWNLSRPRAYELMSAVGIVSAIADTGLPAPTNEGQARELARVPEGERAEVWRETLERTGGKPTAAATRTIARMRQTAALLIQRAYSPDHLRRWLGEVTPARPEQATPDLLDAAVAYLNARGITYRGVADAAEAIRAELPATQPPVLDRTDDEAPAEAPGSDATAPAAHPAPEPNTWYGGPPDLPEPDDGPPDPVPLPGRQSEADAAVHHFDRAAAEAERGRPTEPSKAVIDYIAADPAWQDQAYVTAFTKALARGHDLLAFDPARLGRIGPESMPGELDSYLTGVEKFITAFRAARRGLRVIEGGQ